MVRERRQRQLHNAHDQFRPFETVGAHTVFDGLDTLDVTFDGDLDVLSVGALTLLDDTIAWYECGSDRQSELYSAHNSARPPIHSHHRDFSRRTWHGDGDTDVPQCVAQ